MSAREKGGGAERSGCRTYGLSASEQALWVITYVCAGFSSASLQIWCQAHLACRQLGSPLWIGWSDLGHCDGSSHACDHRWLTAVSKSWAMSWPGRQVVATRKTKTAQHLTAHHRAQPLGTNGLQSGTSSPLELIPELDSQYGTSSQLYSHVQPQRSASGLSHHGAWLSRGERPRTFMGSSNRSWPPNPNLSLS